MQKLRGKTVVVKASGFSVFSEIPLVFFTVGFRKETIGSYWCFSSQILPINMAPTTTRQRKGAELGTHDELAVTSC